MYILHEYETAGIEAAQGKIVQEFAHPMSNVPKRFKTTVPKELDDIQLDPSALNNKKVAERKMHKLAY